MGALKLTYREELPTLKVVKGFSFSIEKSCAGLYRYGFNGKESDNEIDGVQGSKLDFGARIYDSRLGKFLSVDEFANDFPFQSSYVFAGNTPVMAIDMNGDYIYFAIKEFNSETGKTEIKIIEAKTVEDLKQFAGMKILLQTDKGREEVLSYLNNPDHDVYITVTKVNAETNTAGATYHTKAPYDNAIDMETGWNSSKIEEEDHREGMKNFDGIVPRKDSKSSSFIYINQNKVFGGGGGEGIADPLEFQKNAARAIIHEIYAHITQALKGIPVKDHHEEYGEISLKGYEKDSKAAEFNEEINEVEEINPIEK